MDLLTPTERKRQGYIHELIVTEENYVNDLQLVTEVRTAEGPGAAGGMGQRGGTGVLCPDSQSEMLAAVWEHLMVHHTGDASPREEG